MGLWGGGKNIQIGGARSVEKNKTGSNQTGSWWCKPGESVNQAKVFRAHAVLQGLCGNLIDALKSLANQLVDGDGFIQNIVTNLCEGSRKGLTEGVREFIEIDNHFRFGSRTLEGRHGVLEGTKSERGRRTPRGDYQEAQKKLTRRAEEVGTWKSYINVDHMAKERWGHLVGADWHAFSQALYEGIEGEDWRELHVAYKEMSRAVGVKKPQEAQKAKVLWILKAAKDAREEYYDPACEDNILGETRHDQHIVKSTSKTLLWRWSKP